jgi:hypothetical protein
MKWICCLLLVLFAGFSVESVEAKKRAQSKTSQSKSSKLRKRGQFVV